MQELAKISVGDLLKLRCTLNFIVQSRVFFCLLKRKNALEINDKSMAIRF